MNDLVVQQQVHEITPIMYEGQRVLTFKQIDAVHRRPSGAANDAFNSNRNRYQEGKHYYTVSYRVWPEIAPTLASPANRRDITLITERGYLLLVKSFTDDLAWEILDHFDKG